MADLTEQDRQDVRDRLMRRFGYALTKADIRAAIDATDDWIDDNQASYNAAIPLPARTDLNISQKTILFATVSLKRAGIDF